MNVEIMIDSIITLNKKTKNLFDKSVFKIGQKFGLSGSEALILYIVYLNPKLKNSCNIVKRHGYSKAYVSNAMQSLAKKGYISLITDTTDKRFQKVSILPKSQAILKKLEEEHNRIKKVITKNISKEENEEFLKVINKIIDNIKKEEEKNV